MKCSKEKPYRVWTERTSDSFKYLIHIKNKSKTKIRRLTIQLHKANLGFCLRPSCRKSDDDKTEHGTIIESRGDHWHKVEVQPGQNFTFELDYVPNKKDVMTKVRCIVCYVNKNCEDRDVEAVATADQTCMRVTKFIKMSNW